MPVSMAGGFGAVAIAVFAALTLAVVTRIAQRVEIARKAEERRLNRERTAALERELFGDEDAPG